MKKFRPFLVLLFLCNIFTSQSSAYKTVDDDKDYILVLNSINFNEMETYKLFECISNEFSTDKIEVISENLSLKLDVREEALAIPALRDTLEIAGKRNYLHEKYSRMKKPRVLIFIGDPGWLLCKTLFDGLWKDVPAIICMARDKMLPDIADMIDKDGAYLETRLRPTEEVIGGYNAVALKQPLCFKETIELMNGLIPEMKQLFFISDQRYISAYSRLGIKNVVKNDFPHLELKELTSPGLGTEALLDSLSKLDRHAGIIYFSWFVPVHGRLDAYLKDNIRSLIHASVKSPVFIIADIDSEQSNFAGGHYVHMKGQAEACTQLIYRILRGEQPKDIPTIQGGQPYTQLNYARLHDAGIPEKLYPSDAVFVQFPPTFWEKNKWHIAIWGLMLIVIAVILSMQRHVIRIKQRMRDQKMKMLQEYQELVNSMPVVYGRYRFMKGASGGYEDYEILNVNIAFKKLFRIPREEAVGKRFSELADSYPGIRQLTPLHLFSTDTHAVMNEDGTVSYLDKTLCKVYTDGMEDVFDIYGTDNTQLHTIWNKTEYDKDILKRVFDNLPFSIVLRDMKNDLQTIYWNKKTEELFGPNPEHVKNGTVSFDRTDARLRHFNNMDRAVARTGESIADICKFGTEGGEARYYSVRKWIIAPNQWLISTIWDVTEEQRTQQQMVELTERLQTVMKAAKMAVWEYDIKRKTITTDNKYATNSAQKLPACMSFTMDEFRQLLHPDDLQPLTEAYRAFKERRSDSLDVEFRLTDGKTTDWVRVYGAVLKTDQRKAPCMMIGAAININTRKKLEEELRQAKEEAENSNRLKSAFLANMSHEIRTPLNAIVGFSDVLAQTDSPAEKQEYVNIIENNNRLLLQLINDILDLSKIEANTLDFVYTDVDVNALFEELEQSSRLRMNNPQVDISFIERMPELVLHTDRNRLLQVMNNLMTNAMKFTHQGHIHFGYRMRNEGILHFFLSDTGEGIPQEQQQRIFERFVKLDSFKQGTGLGLSICRSIIEKLGGRIGVDSEVGKGTTFWFDIPYVSPKNTMAIPVANMPRNEMVYTGKEKPLILIAEDNPSNFHLFETILKKDYALIHAWNGKEAVLLFEEHRPHLILMDIKMPLIDGYEATQKIREKSLSVPIIAVTAYAFGSDETRIMNSGFNAYISKPIQSGLLKETILKMLIR